MAYEVKITSPVGGELKAIRAFDQRRILDAINHHLGHQPTVTTWNRKCLDEDDFDFECEPPVWELRIGNHRVSYDVDVPGQVVHMRAIRFKDQGQTTGDIIHEREDL